MFSIAILIGIYAYGIYLLGLLNLLRSPIIILFGISFVLISVFFMKKNINKYNIRAELMNFIKKSTKLELSFLTIILIQGLVNLIGVLGPELGFDALWYHLTLPKIYLLNHSIDYIPGGLFYYSLMPRLTEMLYMAGFTFGNEAIAKLIHFSFGILSLIALYKLSRMFLSKKFSLLVLLLFYSNLVVGWMSITAYIDLARTFFEIMSLWGFFRWIEEGKSKWFIVSAILLGLAISTKLLALGSLFIFSILILIRTKRIIKVLKYWLVCLLIPLPWFVFSFIHAGSPIYPFLTNAYPVKLNLSFINPLNLPDPISPFYIIAIPISILLYKKFESTKKQLLLYSSLAILIWQITPQTGGGRFILPYLPVLSIVSIMVLEMLKVEKIRYILVALVVVLSLFSIAYRLGANFKYIPVILGIEPKSSFLSNNLNFSFGDFYDTDGYFSEKIKKDDIVLLYGFHNLYYVNFPFIDSSYVKKGDIFNYIAVQKGNIPERFKMWNLIYYNKKTDVKLYSIGGIKWVY